MTVLVRWARRRLAVVLLTCALVTVITMLVAPTGSSSYTAEARFLVSTGASSKGPGATNEAITGAQVLASVIPSSDVVLSAVPGLTQQEVADRLNVTSDGNGQVIVKFTEDTAAAAQTGAYDIAATLRSGVGSVVPVNSIRLVSTPSPRTTTASHPTSTATHLAIGLGLGLLLGALLAVAWDRRDRRIDEPEDLSRVLDTTVTSLTTMSEWQARGLRQRWLSADPNNDGVVALVSCRSHMSDPLPWLHTEFGEVAKAAGLRLTRTNDRLVKNLAAVKTLSGTTLLFAGPVGTEGAVAGTLVADVTVLAVTEGTPARDVLECRRLLTQQGVAPYWALIVPRGAARAAERAEQRLVRSARPRPGDGRQVPPISAVEAPTTVEPAAAFTEPAEPTESTDTADTADTATPPNGAPAHGRSRIVLEPPAAGTDPGSAGRTSAEPAATRPAVADSAFGEPTLSGPNLGAPADDEPHPDASTTNGATNGSTNGSASIDNDLEQLLSTGDQPARRSGRSVTRRSRSRAR